jgi:hypothetical protein
LKGEIAESFLGVGGSGFWYEGDNAVEISFMLILSYLILIDRHLDLPFSFS